MDSDKWIQSPAGVTGTRVDSNSGGHLSGVGGVGGGGRWSSSSSWTTQLPTAAEPPQSTNKGFVVSYMWDVTTMKTRRMAGHKATDACTVYQTLE